MRISLKPIHQQRIVLTGATSGIGLVTARMAAREGARLVLAARSEDALRRLTNEINSRGGESIYVVADVGSESDVRRIAESAIERFGGFDTWINNAGVSIYGRLRDVPIGDHRRLFETNYWGLVHGSLIAAEHLRSRGGALINIGSTLSDRAIPLQGAYCASKHAVRAFTDSLRMELEEAGSPVSVTLIKPAGIDTPYARHARNLMDVEQKNPPPIYAPETVAHAILHAATHPKREIFVGAGGKALSISEKLAPRVTDKVMERVMFDLQQTGQPASHEREGLYEAAGELEERGSYPGHVAESSLYTRAATHPFVTGALLAAAGIGLSALLLRTSTHRKPVVEEPDLELAEWKV